MQGVSRVFVFAFCCLLAGIALLWSPDIRVQFFNSDTLQPSQVIGTSFPKTLIDATGHSRILERAPTRIASVTLGSDEILSALLDEQRIAAVTHLVDDPWMSNIPNHYSSRIKRIRGEVEEVLALEPDLVIVSRYTRAEIVRQLLSVDTSVLRLSGGHSFRDIESNIKTISQATGTENQALTLLSSLRERTLQVTDRVKDQPPPRVLFYHLDGYTGGEGTTIDQMIRIAGGHNVVSEAGIKGSQKISLEMAIGLEPEVILVSGITQAAQTKPSDFLLAHPSWQQVPAVRDNRVHDLQGRWLISVSQYSWNGIKEIATWLHPEVFD